MDAPKHQSKNSAESGVFGKLDAEAPLWILLPKLLAAISISTGLVLVIFWLNFGRLDGFAYGFAVFLAALQLLIVIGLRFQDRTGLHAEKPLPNDWLDKIGAWWLMACAFGALLGWVIGKFADPGSAYLLYFHLGKILVTIVLPLVTMLPNARYVSRNAAHIQIPLLIFVTVLPMFVGLSSVMWLWERFFS